MRHLFWSHLGEFRLRPKMFCVVLEELLESPGGAREWVRVDRAMYLRASETRKQLKDGEPGRW